MIVIDPLKSLSGFDKWFYVAKFYYLQKCIGGGVYVYISPRLFDGYMIQLYRRGMTGICDLEYRSFDLIELMELGNKWLQEFADGDKERIHAHHYSPYNHAGYWQEKAKERYRQ